MREAKDAFAKAKLVCKAQWPSLNRETAVPYERCVSDAEEATILPASGAFSDLVAQRIAFRNVLATKVASGEVSVEDAQLRFAQFNTGLADAARSREAGMAAEQSERAQAAASTMAATAALIEAARPPPAPPPQVYVPSQPLRTNCTNYGNMTNCTTQ
jgi:hypothetical protein